MAETVSLVYDFLGEVEHQLALGLDLVADSTLKNKHKTAATVSGASVESGTLTAASSPPVTKVYSDEITLSGGAATIDLTSLAQAVSGTQTFAGLKVQFYKFAVDDQQSGAFTITEGATFPYDLFGGASGQIIIGGASKAAVVQFYVPDQLEDVDATHKTIDIAGTGTDSIQVLIVAG